MEKELSKCCGAEKFDCRQDFCFKGCPLCSKCLKPFEVAELINHRERKILKMVKTFEKNFMETNQQNNKWIDDFVNTMEKLEIPTEKRPAIINMINRSHREIISQLKKEIYAEYHKVFTRSEWVRYQVGLRDELKQEMVEKDKREDVNKTTPFVNIDEGDVNKLKEEVKDALENGKDYNSAEELFDDVLDMKHYCSNCESDFEGIGDGTCPECEEKFEEQRWWEGGLKYEVMEDYITVAEDFPQGEIKKQLMREHLQILKDFIKQVEDKAREEERERILKSCNIIKFNGTEGYTRDEIEEKILRGEPIIYKVKRT